MDLSTGERWRERDIPAALERLSKADRLIGHNVLRYDLPMLKKLYGWEPAPCVVIRDTKVIARLKHPNLNETDGALIDKGRMPPGKAYRGKHTIGAWGYRLGLPKLHEDITDWSEWTADMEDRCAGDVETNLRLWDHLGADAYSQDAIELEQRVDLLVWYMEIEGVPFDLSAAEALKVKLTERAEVLEDEIKKQFGFWFKPVTVNASAEDRYTFMPRVSFPKRGITKGAPYCKIERVDFNPGSRQHVERVLRDRGWTPVEYNADGSAKLDDNVIDALCKQFPEIAGLGELFMVRKRLGQLSDGAQALMRCVGMDGRIHGAINPMGTTTSRGAHMHPNLGQVPGAQSPFGREFRSLFKMPPGWVLVGADMSGLEGRGLAHYLAAFDGGAYWEVLSKGDPHWDSTRALGLVSRGEARDTVGPLKALHRTLREGAKRFYYAFIYGAMEHKCGEIILETVAAARKLTGDDTLWRKFFRGSEDPKGDKLLWRLGSHARETFIEMIPGLEKLIGLATDQVRRFGAIRGLDGRIIPARALHSALNFLIQSAGAILCKRWICDAFDELLASGLRHGWAGDFVFVLWVHDEIQVACREGLEHKIGEVLVKHAKLAGEHYAFRIALASEYSTGRSWADTH